MYYLCTLGRLTLLIRLVISYKKNKKKIKKKKNFSAPSVKPINIMCRLAKHAFGCRLLPNI